MHLVGRDEAQVLFAVGGESYASVEEHFEIGPHLGEVFGTRNLHQTHQHCHHPRGYTSNGGDVGAEGFLCDEVALLLKIFQKCYAFGGYTKQAHERRSVFVENSTQISHARSGGVVVGLVTTAKNEGFSREESAFGIVVQIECHRISTTGIMDLLESLLADGDKLALVVRGSG